MGETQRSRTPRNDQINRDSNFTPYTADMVILPKISGVCKPNFLGMISEENLMKNRRYSDAQIMGILKQAEAEDNYYAQRDAFDMVA